MKHKLRHLLFLSFALTVAAIMAVAFQPQRVSAASDIPCPKAEGVECDEFKKSIADCEGKGKDASECVDAWTTCQISFNTTSGTPTADQNRFCLSKIAEGKLAEANKTYYTVPPPAPGPGPSPGVDPALPDNTCNIGAIGWILCPLVDVSANIIDASYGVVAGMLTLQPILSTGGTSSSPIYNAWSLMRNIANVLFVGAFLIIVFSHVTSVGIGNYSMKRMLPRLIVAAILVNLSFWICAIAVDLSNIVGVGIKNLLDNIQEGTFASRFQVPDSSMGENPGQWRALVLAVFAVTGVGLVWYGLAALLPMLVAALFAIFIVFLVLLMRQALIILLIVVSPLAFVAYLLPNTEQWFKRWRQLFQVLLIMFPLISLLFSASAIASTIVRASSITTAPDGTVSTNIPVEIMGAALSVIPLAITPLVMKVSGGVLGRFAGFANNANRGLFDKARKGAENMGQRVENRREISALNGGRLLSSRFNPFGHLYRRRVKNDAVNSSLKSTVSREQTQFVSKEIAADEDFQNKMAGGTPLPKWTKSPRLGKIGRFAQDINEKFGGKADGKYQDRVLANAVSTNKRARDEETAAAGVILHANNLGLDEVQELAKGGTVKFNDASGKPTTITARPGSALQTAAIMQQFKTGDVAKTDALVKMSGGMGEEQRLAVQDGMRQLSGKVQHYGGFAPEMAAKGNINGQLDFDKLIVDNINAGKYSPEVLLRSDKDSLSEVARVLAAGGTTDRQGRPVPIESTGAARMRENAKRAFDDPTLQKAQDRNMARISAIEQGVAYSDNDMHGLLAAQKQRQAAEAAARKQQEEQEAEARQQAQQGQGQNATTQPSNPAANPAQPAATTPGPAAQTNPQPSQPGPAPASPATASPAPASDPQTPASPASPVVLPQSASALTALDLKQAFRSETEAVIQALDRTNVNQVDAIRQLAEQMRHDTSVNDRQLTQYALGQTDLTLTHASGQQDLYMTSNTAGRQAAIIAAVTRSEGPQATVDATYNKIMPKHSP